MDVIRTAQDLIRFRTETGNLEEIRKCFAYIADLFDSSGALVRIFEKPGIAPVLFLSNSEAEDFDVLILGHLDVVPAEDKMFEPYIKDGKMFGRGTLDMKSFAAVALSSMFHVLQNNLKLKFGVILSSDEEKGSKGTEAFMEAHPDMKAKIVLDNDVGGDILKIVSKCKNPVFVKIESVGKEAHGSTPWEGIDANENLLTVLNNIRKIYPYFSKNEPMPENTWIDTVHIAKICGGQVSNVISNYAEALLDFRLIETSSVDNLKKNLDNCMVTGVTYKIASSSVPVVMDENNQGLQWSHIEPLCILRALARQLWMLLLALVWPQAPRWVYIGVPPVLAAAGRWLDLYFAGRRPHFTPPLHLTGTEFRMAVWSLLQEIPYGETTTYGELARQLAQRLEVPHMSAQAVGGAVGHNPISLMIPCHRVVGTNGSLTGYGGGIQRKKALLELECADMRGLFVPKKGTAL